MKRFLMFFIVFVGLASFSNAAEIFTKGTTTFSIRADWGSTSAGSTLPDLTSNVSTNASEIRTILNNLSTGLKADKFYTNEEFENFIQLSLDHFNTLYSKNYDSYFYVYVKSGTHHCYFFDSSQIDIIGYSGTSTEPISVYSSYLLNSDYVQLSTTSSNVFATYHSITLENVFNTFTRYEGDFSTYPYKSNATIKLASQKSLLNGYYDIEWDGESYFQYIEEGPNVPDYSSDLAGLISAITTSDVIKDNIDTHKLEYFVIYNGEAFGDFYYDVYFYNENINFAYFEYLDANDNLRYDLNKTSVDGIIGKISDFFVGEHMKCQKFRVGYNPEIGNSSVGYIGKSNISEDLEGFSVELTPLVYTSKDIPYYFYEYDETTNQSIATPDTDKDIKTQVITDSEGNEISTVVTPSSSLIGETTWNKVLNAILSIPESILAGIKKLFIPDLSYLQGTMENLKTKLGFITQARNIVEDITNGIELNPTAPPSIKIDLTNANSKYNWGTEALCIDLSWYAPFKPAVDFLIICFAYGFFFWNLFRKLPDIINGVAGDVPMMSYQVERVSNNSNRERIGFRTK